MLFDIKQGTFDLLEPFLDRLLVVGGQGDVEEEDDAPGVAAQFSQADPLLDFFY
jgi:hypothetical protein